MPVGIDFDNTIVRYDRVFADAAKARGWVPWNFRGSKKQLRDTVRRLPDGEIKWQILQGEVYGPRMGDAEPFPGVMEFICAARRRGIEIFVVSHKTQYSNYDASKTDLRQAAMDWMENNGFFDPATLGFSRQEIFFTNTRAEKIAQISVLSCGVFIDDLEEVFADPSFPSKVKKVLFSCEVEASENHEIVIRKSWPDIASFVLECAQNAPDIEGVAARVGARLAGDALRSVQSSRSSGGNNRLFRIETEDGRIYALKSYLTQASDPRDRLSTEFGALEFMRRHGIDRVPRPIAKDHEAGFALYDWISGEPARPSVTAIDAAVAFIGALHQLKGAPDATLIGPASEACLSAQAVIEQVQTRLTALQAHTPVHPELADFLRTEFAWGAECAVMHARKIYGQAELDFDAPLAQNLRCLSPSDFGFHNALTCDDGRVVFLDFEYFGWDDPIKLTSDFVLHPGMDLTAELKRRFVDSMSDIFRIDETFAVRLHASLPLYALRWAMILLNEFLPERWERRVLAGRGGDRSAVLNTQLDKARKMLRQVENGVFAS